MVRQAGRSRLAQGAAVWPRDRADSGTSLCSPGHLSHLSTSVPSPVKCG